MLMSPPKDKASHFKRSSLTNLPTSFKKKVNPNTDERKKLVIQGWTGHPNERQNDSLIYSSLPESAVSASNKESHTHDQIQALLVAGQEMKR